ncbi:MAG TPA: zinc-dependent alcohol dehydrogenase family protein [Pyrinomonadaceae bacterium]
MKACVLEKPALVDEHPLVISDVPRPTPGEGEILLRVEACGICRTDLHVVEGELPARLSPVIPGHQVVGIVEAVGTGVASRATGERVGAAWLHSTCGECRFCITGRENLCERAQFTGWSCHGGFAEFMVAAADFVYPLPGNLESTQAAPLLCAGIIGYRALRLTGVSAWEGARLGIYGFGAAGHICIQIARSRGADVYVATRDRSRHRVLAEELGAAWVGDTFDQPPVQLDTAIIFAPAGEIIPTALKALDRGGTLVLGGIHMSPIPQFEYDLIYGERSIKSVANNTRDDGRDFLIEAASIPVRTSVTTFELGQANEALIALKNDAIKGAGVMRID